MVHLLTELVDNALNFSPPSEPVRLAAKLGADGATITVTDSGLGVPAAELDLLNRDLSHGAEATPDTARRMGLFVVSRLAERHGVVVSLAKNPGGGMTATVLLPPSILPELPQTAAPAATPAVGKTSTQSTSTPAPVAVAAAAAVLTTDDTSVAEPTRRRGLSLGRRSEKSADKAAGKAAAAEAKAAEKAAAAEAKAADKAARKDAVTSEPELPAAAPVAGAAAAAAVVVSSGEPTPGRPPLGSLLPRREPGANIPRTGADAFEPTTSGETGPLFGKRTPDAAPEPAESVDQSGEGAESPEPAASDDSSDIGQVASVVSITALASRQRAQAEEARASEEAAGRSSRSPRPRTRSRSPLPSAVPRRPGRGAGRRGARRRDPSRPADRPADLRGLRRRTGRGRAGRRAGGGSRARAGGGSRARPPSPTTYPWTSTTRWASTHPRPAPRWRRSPRSPGPPSSRRRRWRPPRSRPSSRPASGGVEAPAAYANGALSAGLAGGLPTRTRGAADEINRDMPGLPPAYR